MKFPKRIKVRGRVLATIYGPSSAYPMYRVCWRANGKRRTKAFAQFAGPEGANEFAEKVAKDVDRGSHVTALTSSQATDALAALERLQGFYDSTGRRHSLLSAVSEFIESSALLEGHSLREAVKGFKRTVATVKRQDIGKAVEEFLSSEEPRTRAKEGQRAQLSSKYHYNRAVILRRFAGMFPNTAICDFGKQHLDSFFGAKPLNEFSPKSRNHHRAAIRQFLQWCVRKDYLSREHRLGEADGLRIEHANSAEILFYNPKEFRWLLEHSTGPMRALIAIGGFCGLRTSELLRLRWTDVWRTTGHVEVTAGNAKTRKRRLVEMCSALKFWLEPFMELSGLIWAGDPALSAKRNENLFHKQFGALCTRVGILRKENGLRHSFVSFHYALHSNENLTAAAAGNTPAIIHAHYKGLATRAEAEAWFAVAPAKAENILPLANAVGMEK